MYSNTTEFNMETMVQELRDAAQLDNPGANIREIMDRVLASPQIVSDNMPAYDEDDVVIFEDETISIWKCTFRPGIPVPPHNHKMSATIGVYEGVERNTFFKASDSTGISPSSETDIGPGDVLSLGPSAIHCVECISDTPSSGLHVYLGKLTTVERDLYDLGTGRKLSFSDEEYERLRLQTIAERNEQ